MNNEEEIEIIDDVGGSIEVNNNPVDPNTMNNEINNNEEFSVFSGNPNEVDNSNITIPNEEVTPVTNTIEEPNIFSEVPIEQPIVNSEEVTNNVDNSIIENPIQEEPLNEDSNISSENNIPMDETKEEIVSDVITPNEEVVPQEINNEIINDSAVIDEVVNDVPSPSVEISSNDINADTMVASNNDENVIDIKTTSKIQNEVGTTVIGEINGDNVAVVGESIPDSIDINSKDIPNNEEKNKKVKIKSGKSSSIIIILLLVAIIGAAGYFGVNYFINNNNAFEVKNVTLELGESIPQSVSYYVTANNIKESEYTIDLSNVSNEVGTYNYTITHKGNTKTGTIVISDTKGPEVTFKDNLMFAKDITITKESLVSSCNDPSNCVYELVGTIDTTNSGSQEVTISAKDDFGNVSSVTTSISIIAKNLVCKSEETLSEDGTYSERLEDVFYFDDENKYISSVGKKVTTFVDYGSFFALINEQENNSEYNFDRKTFSYWVTNDILYKDGTTMEDIQSYYTNNKYTCS